VLYLHRDPEEESVTHLMLFLCHVERIIACNVVLLSHLVILKFCGAFKQQSEEDIFMASLICNMDADCGKLLVGKPDLNCGKTLHFDTKVVLGFRFLEI